MHFSRFLLSLRMLLVIAVVLGMAIMPACGQREQEEAPVSRKKIDETRLPYATSIQVSDLSRHIKVLTSNDFAGRESGTEGQRKAARYIASQFESYGLEAVVTVDGQKSYFQPFLLRNEGVPSENVVAALKGDEKEDEWVIITAHYDHLGTRGEDIYYGADDNGSGTSALLEIAEAFALAKAEGNTTTRSLLFIAMAGEEKGLLGSAYYAENPIYPLANTVANLNMDMIGRVDDAHRNDPNYVYLIGSDKLSSELHTLSETTNATYTQLVLDYRYNDENDPNRFYYRSDHYNFAKNNIPVIFYFSGVHKDYHQPTDTMDKLLMNKYRLIVELVFHTAWEIADRPNRLKVDKVATAADKN